MVVLKYQANKCYSELLEIPAQYCSLNLKKKKKKKKKSGLLKKRSLKFGISLILVLEIPKK